MQSKRLYSTFLISFEHNIKKKHVVALVTQEKEKVKLNIFQEVNKSIEFVNNKSNSTFRDARINCRYNPSMFGDSIATKPRYHN